MTTVITTLNQLGLLMSQPNPDHLLLQLAGMEGAPLALDVLKQEFRAICTYYRDGLPLLRDALVNGRVDGSTFFKSRYADSVCLFGTLMLAYPARNAMVEANRYNKTYTRQRNHWGNFSPSEFMFIHIRRGMRPETHPLVALFLVWTDELIAELA